VLIRQHERQVEELDVQLTFDKPITGSGAIMTLPAATADLKDWIGDEREFTSVQRDGWMQVIGDFRDSLAKTGPKFSRHVEPITSRIESRLPELISPSAPDPVTPSPIATFLQRFAPPDWSNGVVARIDSLLRRLVPPPPSETKKQTYTIDDGARSEIAGLLEQLDVEMLNPAATVAASRDLVTSTEIGREVEEISFRRDTLFAMAEHRNLNVAERGNGLFWRLSLLVTDAADDVLREEAIANGAEPTSVAREDIWAPSGVPTWRRLQLCEQVIVREPWRADCIVWLRLEKTNLPQHEVTHGQVTFYNAALLSGCVGHPEYTDQFEVPPTELLAPIPPEKEPIVPEGEVEWERDHHMIYARVVLPNIEVHAADATARSLVEAFKAVNHAAKHTWCILNGRILFIDGQRSFFSWGPKAGTPESFQPLNDWMGRDVEKMARNNRYLDAQSVHELRDVMAMSTALDTAAQESPQATVMTAVRAIEHVNAWTTGGVKNWVDFASAFLKKAQGRVRVVEFISYKLDIARPQSILDTSSAAATTQPYRRCKPPPPATPHICDGQTFQGNGLDPDAKGNRLHRSLCVWVLGHAPTQQPCRRDAIRCGKPATQRVEGLAPHRSNPGRKPVIGAVVGSHRGWHLNTLATCAFRGLSHDDCGSFVSRSEAFLPNRVEPLGSCDDLRFCLHLASAGIPIAIAYRLSSLCGGYGRDDGWPCRTVGGQSAEGRAREGGHVAT
jgi:hypothetical protein